MWNLELKGAGCNKESIKENSELSSRLVLAIEKGIKFEGTEITKNKSLLQWLHSIRLFQV